MCNEILRPAAPSVCEVKNNYLISEQRIQTREGGNLLHGYQCSKKPNTKKTVKIELIMQEGRGN